MSKIPNDMNSIKNYEKRQQIYHKKKIMKNREKMNRHKSRKKNPIPEDQKEVPKTLDNQRIRDDVSENMVSSETIEKYVLENYVNYMEKNKKPKILITVSSEGRCSQNTYRFVEELVLIIPNAIKFKKKNMPLKKLISIATEEGYTDVILVGEDHKQPNRMILSHLPHGPTAWFKLSSIQLSSEIEGHANFTHMIPEVMLNNFTTVLGRAVSRMLMALFPLKPQFRGRQAVVWHNQRDFIFFRAFRYIFEDRTKVDTQELGPQFCLKLVHLQKGTFDTKNGSYIWNPKRHDVEARRRFFL